MKFKRISAVIASLALMATMLPAFPVVKAEEELKDSGIDYSEIVKTINNPAMGYTTTLWYNCKPNETKIQNPSGSLVLMFVDIGAFSSGANGTTDEAGNYTEGIDYDLDETFFKAMRGTLENCRKNGSTVALRFRYDANGKTNPEPATFEQLLHHIDQIKQDGFLEDYKDILMFVESGFVGAWGEQHSGKYTSLEYKAQLLQAVLDMTPDDIPVTVRTPNIFRQWAGISMDEMAEWTSEKGSQASRVGMYNDGYMGSDSDLGTYSNREIETAWLGRQTTATYYGGEFSGNLDWAKKYDTYLPENAIPEMYKTHLSYINGNIYQLYKDYTFGADYDVEGVNNTAYYGQTVFQFVRDHLGYRFVLRDSDLSADVCAGGNFELDFSVENTGFANPIRPQKAELILKRNGNYITTTTDIDSREWRSCTTSNEKLSVQIPASLEAGDWKVYLRLSVGEQDVQDGNLRTVQFANDNIWNASLGANYLGTVSVNRDTPSVSQAFKVNGVGTDSAQLYTMNNLITLDGGRSSDTEWTADNLKADTDGNQMYITNDDEYLYIGAEIHQNAVKPVINLRVKNADTDKSYWYYRQSAGWIYYSQGSYDGIMLKTEGDFIEFRIPFGDVMDLHAGTVLENVTIFIQDESVEGWAKTGSITAENYTITPKFPIYSAFQSVTLTEGDNYSINAVTGAVDASYTWYHDGKETECNSQILTLKNITEKDKGLYSVKVTSGEISCTYELCNIEEVVPQTPPSILLPFGDLNLDGSLNETDVKLLQDYLHKKDVHIYANADLNNDGVWNVIDLALLKRLGTVNI